MSFSFKVSTIAKSFLPRAVGNLLPLLYKPGDKIVYEGFEQQDLPRFSNDTDRADSRYSVGYGSNLTCNGWCYGYYDKDGNFQKTRNPLSEIFYVFNGELLDNETFVPHGDKENNNPTVHIHEPDKNIFQDELNLPSDADLRESLDYPDAKHISDLEAAEDLIYRMAAQSNRVPTTPPASPVENSGTYEDERGTFKTVKGIFCIAESILMGRIQKNYYWTIEKAGQGKSDYLVISGYKRSEYRDAA